MHKAIVLIICLVVSGCFSQQPPASKPHSSPDGVSIEGISVGNLSRDEISAILIDLSAQRNTLPKNAAFDSLGNIMSDQPGKMLDVQATLSVIMNAMPNSEVTAVYSELSPPVSLLRLERASQIGSYATPILDDSSERMHNLVLTAKLLNNTMIEPGQEFSFNTVTGEPTAERGFREAVIIQNGQKAQGIGGGMCQVSTTIYNAALAAGLPIVERHPHSQPVSYVTEGRDATTFTNMDLRFLNSTRQVLMLRVIVAEKTVRADIWALPGS